MRPRCTVTWGLCMRLLLRHALKTASVPHRFLVVSKTRQCAASSGDCTDLHAAIAQHVHNRANSTWSVMKWLRRSELRQRPRGGLKAYYRKAEDRDHDTIHIMPQRHETKPIMRLQRVLQVLFKSVVLWPCIRIWGRHQYFSTNYDR
jgi:hypothetical protein